MADNQPQSSLGIGFIPPTQNSAPKHLTPDTPPFPVKPRRSTRCSEAQLSLLKLLISNSLLFCPGPCTLLGPGHDEMPYAKRTSPLITWDRRTPHKPPSPQPARIIKLVNSPLSLHTQPTPPIASDRGAGCMSRQHHFWFQTEYTCHTALCWISSYRHKSSSRAECG